MARRIRYRMTEDGEVRSYASAKRRRAMGVDWATHHARQPDQPEPCKLGDATHDDACAVAWKQLTGQYPSWYKKND